MGVCQSKCPEGGTRLPQAVGRGMECPVSLAGDFTGARPALEHAKKPPGEQNRTAEKEENAVLQDVDVFPGQRLVHAADGAELAAHGAGVAVVVLRQAGIADGLGGLRIERTGKLGIPVQHPAGVLRAMPSSLMV